MIITASWFLNQNHIADVLARRAVWIELPTSARRLLTDLVEKCKLKMFRIYHFESSCAIGVNMHTHTPSVVTQFSSQFSSQRDRSMQRRSVGYRRSGRTAILPPPKSRESWDAWCLLIAPIFAVSAPNFSVITLNLPPFPDCRPEQSTPSAPSRYSPLNQLQAE